MGLIGKVSFWKHLNGVDTTIVKTIIKNSIFKEFLLQSANTNNDDIEINKLPLLCNCKILGDKAED